MAIARVLALEPEVLLMDEPFSALDAITREELYVELQQLWQKRGTTIVFVTHNTREAVTLGDRVLLLATDPGRIQMEVKVDIPRPRHIDDVEVARTAQVLSGAMRQARKNSLWEEELDEMDTKTDLLRDPDSALVDRSQ